MVGQRFPTREPKAELDKRLADPDRATPVDKAMKVVHDAMDGKKMAGKLRGANIVRLMEMSNQRDDLADDPFTGMSDSDGVAPTVHNTQIIFNMPNNRRGPAKLHGTSDGDD